jgi:hypothetical protein
MQQSEQKKGKSMFGSTSQEGSADKGSKGEQVSPSKGKILNIMIEEKVAKKSKDNSDTSYCAII